MEYFTITEGRRQEITAEWFSPDTMPAIARRYVSLEYDFDRRCWTIEADAFAGIVPLNTEYGIQIYPKSGLRNLTYMLHRSGLLERSLETPFDQTVPYHIPEDDLESFFEGLMRSYLKCLDRIKSLGLFREAVIHSRDAYAVHGKIDLRRWYNRLPHTGGLPIPQLVPETCLDNQPNRLLRWCLEYLLGAHLLYVNTDEILSRLDYFGRVSSNPPSEQEKSDIEHRIDAGRFPSGRRYYLPALNLALLILRGAGLALGDIEDVDFRPILINMKHMFERYVRVLCQEAVSDLEGQAVAGSQIPIPFYAQPSSRNVWVMPDIVIRRDARAMMVADVKYKFAPTEQDHYQLWAYMDAWQVDTGGFISLVGEGLAGEENPVWYRRGEKSVFNYAFDCKNIARTENAFKDFFASQVERVLS